MACQQVYGFPGDAHSLDRWSRHGKDQCSCLYRHDRDWLVNRMKACSGSQSERMDSRQGLGIDTMSA